MTQDAHISCYFFAGSFTFNGHFVNDLGEQVAELFIASGTTSGQTAAQLAGLAELPAEACGMIGDVTGTMKFSTCAKDTDLRKDFNENYATKARTQEAATNVKFGKVFV